MSEDPRWIQRPDSCPFRDSSDSLLSKSGSGFAASTCPSYLLRVGQAFLPLPVSLLPCPDCY